ncbi:hypothetical protein OHA18_08585 [Kribbella sp. NBC_00709]|uniref:hypothetical protein n=1 Tax=Kribbella sp. NBC_00709 TaxID=2975972 RepID=UPI002E2DBEC6|nr:hypothetical protein [Kribbella sp. NBC_00709]
MANLAVPIVLPELGKARWTPAQLFGYEIALEGIRQSVGFYAQQIARAEAAGNLEAAAALRADQATWAQRGHDLDPLNARAVKRIRDAVDALLSVDGEEDTEEAPAAEGELDEQDGRGD